MVRLGEMDTTSLRASISATTVVGSIASTACTLENAPLTVPPRRATCSRKSSISRSDESLTIITSTRRRLPCWRTQRWPGNTGEAIADSRSRAIFLGLPAEPAWAPRPVIKTRVDNIISASGRNKRRSINTMKGINNFMARSLWFAAGRGWNARAADGHNDRDDLYFWVVFADFSVRLCR